MKRIRTRGWMPLLVMLPWLGACSGPEPLPVVDQVDLDRFMGDWYVIAHIPTFIEDQAYNAVETYQRSTENRIATTFRFNQGGFDGEVKVYHPTGFVREHPSNAIWGMQFIWPVKAEYRIAWLDEDYQHTIIGRSQRDYVWLMARTASIDSELLEDFKRRIGDMGYDLTRLRMVPQSPSR